MLFRALFLSSERMLAAVADLFAARREHSPDGHPGQWTQVLGVHAIDSSPRYVSDLLMLITHMPQLRKLDTGLPTTQMEVTTLLEMHTHTLRTLSITVDDLASPPLPTLLKHLSGLSKLDTLRIEIDNTRGENMPIDYAAQNTLPGCFPSLTELTVSCWRQNSASTSLSLAALFAYSFPNLVGVNLRHGISDQMLPPLTRLLNRTTPLQSLHLELDSQDDLAKVLSLPFTVKRLQLGGAPLPENALAVSCVAEHLILSMGYDETVLHFLDAILDVKRKRLRTIQLRFHEIIFAWERDRNEDDEDEGIDMYGHEDDEEARLKAEEDRNIIWGALMKRAFLLKSNGIALLDFLGMGLQLANKAECVLCECL